MPKNEDLNQMRESQNITRTPGTTDVELSYYRVSERTARFIDLRIKVNKLWGELSDALEIDYDPDTTDAFMGKHFTPSLVKINQALEDFIIDSITEDLPTVEKTKVI